MKKRRKNLTAETKLHETAQKLLQQTKRGYEIGGVKHYRDNTYASVAIAQVQDQDWKTVWPLVWAYPTILYFTRPYAGRPKTPTRGGGPWGRPPFLHELKNSFNGSGYK